MNRPCEHIIETLTAGHGLDAAGQRHSEHCPDCAELVRLPGLIGQASSAVEVGPGFSSRMMARASERLIQRHERRRWRMAGGVAAVAAAALVAVGLGTWLPGALSRSSQSELAAVPDGADEQARDRDPDRAGDETPVAETPVAEAFERDVMAEVPGIDDALAYRTDWGAAGGQVDAADIIRRGARLDLTPKQRAAVERIVAEQHKAEIKLRADMEVARIDLRNAIDAADPDENKVATLIDRVSQLEAQVRKKRVLAWLRARKVLTAKQRDYLAADERRRPPAPTPLDGDLDGDLDMPVPPAPPAPEPHRGDLDIDIDPDIDGFEGLENMEIELHGIPELEAMDMREVREAMRRAREDMRQAREQMREELLRARQELERTRNLSDADRQELLRMRQEYLREAGEAREKALRKAGKIREKALREAAKAGEKALRKAERARDRELRQAGKDARQAGKDARRQALEARRQALQELASELEREQRALDRELEIEPPAPPPPAPAPHAAPPARL